MSHERNLIKPNKKKNYVDIKVSTWEKDSHGLFDYEFEHRNIQNFHTERTSQIYRDGPDIILQQNLLKDNESFRSKTLLLNILKNDHESEEKFFIEPSNHHLDDEDSKHKKYLIVRGFKHKDGTSKGISLHVGDILKLGRIEYVITEMQKKNPETGKNSIFHYEPSKDYKIVENTEYKSQDKECRICLSDELTEQGDFFLNPCKCKGSLGTYHFSCLKKWFEIKIFPRPCQNSTSFSWKKPQCEICNEAIPLKICYQNIYYDVFTLKRPERPYIVLQKLQIGKHDFSLASITTLLQFNDNETMTIGRGHQCDLRVSDISVSRNHAFISYQDGEFIVKDNKSKFGTLIFLKNLFEITTEKIAIQVGRTVFRFSLKHFSNKNISDSDEKSIQSYSNFSSGILENEEVFFKPTKKTNTTKMNFYSQ